MSDKDSEHSRDSEDERSRSADDESEHRPEPEEPEEDEEENDNEGNEREGRDAEPEEDREAAAEEEQEDASTSAPAAAAAESTTTSTNKRKRSLSEEQDADSAVADDAKKVKTETAPAAPGSISNSHVKILTQSADSMIMEVTPDKVGQIIGSKGLIIQELQQRTGAKAYVNQDFPPGVNRQLHLSGTAQQIEDAADLVRRIIDHGPTAIHVNSLHGGPPASRVIECTQPQVGKIIGSGGATIKEIQSKSGAKIQIEQNFPPEVPRKIHISGSTAAVNVAAQLIREVIANINASSGGSSGGVHAPGMPSAMSGIPSLMPPYGYGGGAPGQPAPHAAAAAAAAQPMGGGAGDIAQLMEVPKSVVGKIIGRGGETIQLIQRKSGCRVTVDQQVPEGMPCKVRIVGSLHNISLAVQMVQEINMGVHTSKIGANLPPPIATAPTPAGYGLPATQPYGLNPAAPPAAYSLPGYSYPAPQMPYSQYGMAPAAAYGGYPYMSAPGQGLGHAAPTAATAAGGPGAAAYGMPSAPHHAHAHAHAHAHHVPQHHAPQLGSHHSHHVPAAAAPAPKTAASVWTEHKTDDGVTYWYNASTGVSQWERPKNL